MSIDINTGIDNDMDFDHIEVLATCEDPYMHDSRTFYDYSNYIKWLIHLPNVPTLRVVVNVYHGIDYDYTPNCVLAL